MNSHAAVTDDVLDLYRELILDHARSPRHFGCPENATHTAQGVNPLCGDKLSVYLTIDRNESIAAVSFEGSGCANEAIELDVDLERPFAKLKALDGVRKFPPRVKCATLAWHALHSALHQDEQPATTE